MGKFQDEKSSLKLEIINLPEVLKFMSPLVNINHAPFDYSWGPHKEEKIEESKKFLEENFIKEYSRKDPDKDISTVNIKSQCRILKIYDQELDQDHSILTYEYELYDSENNPIIACFTVEAGYGTLHKDLYIQN
ncbi:hypothetical protein [Treponema sp.]|uniref:hypothetical protein n=1 Tax=Treponema sp. TaxID=166 RepID=UPI002600BE37|nr:hypothetical protein [Treponema sp.]MCR5217306.1 hypothetical protein [Treponema sp.]